VGVSKSFIVVVLSFLIASCAVDVEKIESIYSDGSPKSHEDIPEDGFNNEADGGGYNPDNYFEEEPEEGPEYGSAMGYGFVSGSKAVAAALGIGKLSDVENSSGESYRHLDPMKVPEVWEYGLTGQGVVVAVIDTGIDLDHEDLKDRIAINHDEIPSNGIDDDGNGYVDDVHGWDFFDKDNDPTDPKGHGTHVSGIIAAAKNSFGATGVAFNAKILPIKVTGANGATNKYKMVPAIKYATMMGVDVINISMGGQYQPEIEQAIKEAHQSGIIVVMAAGNSGGALPGYPARFSKEFGIAAGSGSPVGLDSYSNRSGEDRLNYVVSPGRQIYSTLPGNSYGKKSGTSMASPNIAGLAALIVEAAPELSVEDKIAAITSTAIHPALSTNMSGLSSTIDSEEIFDMPTITD
jgi:subtilisin family serine protease